MTEPTRLSTHQSTLRRWFPNHEWVLLILLAVEVALFSATGRNFLTVTNAFELVRSGCEVGLLALGMTLVIITGGIDLSVGSMMGMAAITLGWLNNVAGVPIVPAIAVALAMGALGGWMNGALIARLGVPPLIVTLGTYSLFRGLAEGLTKGIINYSSFSDAFKALGNGYWLGCVPRQLPLFLLVAVGVWLLLHRSVFGRQLYALGCSKEGALHAGVPVGRRVVTTYVLSGLLAALAAVVYAARLGQAKADAGTGFELMAITAVVLGGTSIDGGKGTILGTMLGLAAIVMLENGLRLAGQQAEASQVMIGVLLLVAILGHRFGTGGRAGAVASTSRDSCEEFEMKNYQVAILSVAMLLSALIVAGSNKKVAEQMSLLSAAPPVAATQRAGAPPPPPPAKKLTIALMPKNKGEPYFLSCKKGADEAVAALGGQVEFLWDGPANPDPSKQNEVIDAWITRGVDVIAASVENKEAISTVLKKARAKGIKVICWDADAVADARDFMVQQATPEGIGTALMDEAARVMGNKGTFAIVTASLTAANQNEWIVYIKKRLAAKYPDIKLATIEPSEGKRDVAMTRTSALLKANPDVKLVMGIAAPAVPGAAEAVVQSGRKDVKVIGLSLPSLCREFIHKGVVDCIVLWNTVDLGYLTVHAARALAQGDIKAGSTTMEAGRLGKIEIAGDQVLLGKPFVFNKDNVDQFDF